MPKTQVCWWSKANLPHGIPQNQFGFEMQAVVTNLTDAYDLRLVEADIRGIKGTVAWTAITSFLPGKGGVSGAVLPAHVPVDLAVNVVIETSPLAPGPHKARIILMDHLGQRHRSPKVTFNDVRKYQSEGSETASVGKPDLSDPRNRPPSSLPPKRLPRIRRQTGGPIDPL